MDFHFIYIMYLQQILDTDHMAWYGKSKKDQINRPSLSSFKSHHI